MNAWMDLLAIAEKHLLKGETKQALAYLQRFEQMALGREAPRDGLTECAPALRAICQLAESANAGVAMAERQIRDILSLSRDLSTYDSRGRRLARPVRPGQEHRY